MHPEDDQWAKTGWAPRFGTGEAQDSKEDDALLIEHQTFLEGKIDDKFYGDWYHNAAIIVFSCLTSWLVAVIGGGLGWVIIIMAACGTYYRTSIRRTRRNFRDDLVREHALRNIDPDHESLEWINSFLVKFWPIFAPNLAQSIIQSVDQVLSTSTPSFLDSMRLETFTLGTKPPRMEHVKTHAIKDDDTVQMDWRFSFTPTDIEDMTTRQLKNKINPKVVLEIRVGKAMISKALKVIVEDFAFSGLLRLKMKLQLPYPYIEKVDMCFMGRPDIDYVCKPLGGDTFGFDINFIPGLESFIKEQIHANLEPIMYHPHIFPIEIAKMLSGNPVDQAIGVVAVTINSGHGLKNTDIGSGQPDPYVVCSIAGRQELGRTKIVHGTADPRFNETLYIVITSFTDALSLQVFDYNEFRKDKELGVASFALERLQGQPDHSGEQLEVLSGARNRGVLNIDLKFFPVLEAGQDAEGHRLPPPESNTGIAHITIEQAKDLDGTKSMVGKLNPYGVLVLNGKEVHVTKKLKRTNNPIFQDPSKSVLITDRRKARIGLVIKDDRDLAHDPIVGSYQIKLDDLLTLAAKGQEWFNLAESKTGRAKLMVDWKPVALTGVTGSGGYITPIGVMRIHLKSAKDLRNFETIGKSDPYGRVLLNGIQKGRTITFKNNLDPTWDEVIYVPIHTVRERITLEVMDEEKLGKDRSLGLIEIPVAEYVRTDEENGGYLPRDTKESLFDGLRLAGKGVPKGTLNYTLSFFPTMNVIDPDEEAEEASAEASQSPTGLGLQNSADLVTTPPVSGQPVVNQTGNGVASTPLEATTSTHSNGNGSMMSRTPAPKVKLTVDDLQKYETGLLIFQIVEGQFAHNSPILEVIMDDHSFPSYTTTKAKTRNYQFNETGDAFVRELDFSRITLRLVEKVGKPGDDEDEHVLAKVAGQTLQILQRSLYQTHQLTLRGEDGSTNIVTVKLKYLPVQMQLDPSESINNSGTLRVDIMDAVDLPAADRNGYSDPFCKFKLNGKEVHKTHVEKKTLHPAWNESFETQINSRTMADFRLDVYDWDLGGSDDYLGGSGIDLTKLEPMQQREIRYPLDGKSGVVRLRMLFKPAYVARARQGTSTFQGTFAPAGKVVGAPVKGVAKVGGGLQKGASFLKRGIGGRKDSERGVSLNDGPADTFTSPVGAAPMPDVSHPPESPIQNGAMVGTSGSPATPQLMHQRAASTTSTLAGGTPGSDQGTARFTVLSASGYPEKADVQVVINMKGNKSKEVHKTKAHKPRGGVVEYDASHESFQCTCSAATMFEAVVRDHDLFRSKELGTGTFFISDQGPGSEQSIRAGNGMVAIRSSFTPHSAPSSDGLLRPGTGGADADSPASRREGRRSFFSKREGSTRTDAA